MRLVRCGVIQILVYVLDAPFVYMFGLHVGCLVVVVLDLIHCSLACLICQCWDPWRGRPIFRERTPLQWFPVVNVTGVLRPCFVLGAIAADMVHICELWSYSLCIN